MIAKAIALISLLGFVGASAPVRAQSPAPAGGGAAGPMEKLLGGNQFELGMGRALTTITNPDQTEAHYEGIGLQAFGRISLLGNRGRNYQFDLIGSMSYYESKNTVEIESEKESLFLLGPGGGLYARAYYFFVGYQMDYNFCRQYASGPVSRGISYTMITSRLFYGAETKVWGRYGVAVGMSTSTGNLPKNRTGLSQDSPYKNQTLWLNLTYSTGQ